jgi:ketosteroid isomerase-like protein
MSSIEARNIAVVLKYFDGCNSGDLDDLISTLDPEVVHYFLPQQFKPIRGAQHLAKYWRKFKVLLKPTWKIDHIIAQGDEVVSEWSCLWTPEGTDLRLMMRGSEWYQMRENRIAEVRAYFGYSDKSNSELTDFPYGARSFLNDLPNGDA